MADARRTLYKFSNRDKDGKQIKDRSKMTPYNQIHDMIYTGKAFGSNIYNPLAPVCIPGLPILLNKSQIKAVNMAINEPFSIIQGPPGTGKTLTITAIVGSFLQLPPTFSYSKILVCAPSNTAADNLAERLYPLFSN